MIDVTKRQARILLACGIGLGIALQSLCAAFSLRVTYDDANTYLLSTGHRSQFDENRLAGQWVRAREWKRFVRAAESFSFATVTGDATRVDHHPPLYYWLLHVWTYLFGVNLATGKIPGILLNALTCLVVYRICRLVKCARGASVLAAVLWILGAPTMDAANETRQYCLLALMIALFLGSLLRLMDGASKLNAFLLFFSTLGAVFTHYQSIVVIGIAAMAAGVVLVTRREYRRLAGMVGVLVLSVAAFAALHPSFLVAFGLQSGRGQALSWHTMPDRLRRCAFSVLDFLVPTDAAWFIVAHKPLLLTAVVAIAAAGVWYLRKTGVRDFPAGLRDRTCLPAVVSSVSLAAIWTLYLLHFTLRHAMGKKYMMVVTPVLFVAVGQMAHRLWRAGRLSRRAIVIVLVGQGLIVAAATYGIVQGSRSDRGILDDAGVPIVLDNLASGIVLSVLWHASDEALVYADSQEGLLGRFPTDPAGSGKLIYLSDLRMGNKMENRAAILREFRAQGYRARSRDSGIFEETDAYELTQGPR